MRRLPLRSPPRMRGKVPVCCPEHRKVRITPAYAGKRASQLCAGLAPRDHPRVCGEKFSSVKTAGLSTGSPPRMRGKEGQEQVSGRAVGITPACAGKSPSQHR